MEIEIEWFDRHISGGEDRRIFKRERHRSEDGVEITHTFNSKELRAVDVKMQLVPPIGGVRNESRPRRQSADAAAHSWRNILYAAHRQHAPHMDQLWEISEGEESYILDHCCL